MLDLVAEVAADDVEERAALDVGGPDELAHVPGTARLVLDLLLAERVRLIREVAAEDDRVRPHIADDVRREVRPEGRLERLTPAFERPRSDLAEALAAAAAATPPGASQRASRAGPQPFRAGARAPGCDRRLDRRVGESTDERPCDVVLGDLQAGLA